MSTPLRVGLGQQKVIGGDPEKNLAAACRMIEEGARQGCSVVVLPECLDLGWTHPSARELAEPLPGKRSETLARAATAGGVYVVAGLTERCADLLYNSAILLSPVGEILSRHRKINELDFARELYSIGTQVSVVETPLATLGLTVCADNFPETLELAKAQARMGATLLLSPCAWAVPADHDNRKEPYGGLWKQAYTQLTQEHPVTVVGVSNVGRITGGPWEGRKCIGCSLAMGPGGKVLVEGPYGEEAEAFLSFDLVP